MLRTNQWVKAARSGGNNTGPNCVECLQFRVTAGGVADAVASADLLHAHCPPQGCRAVGIADGDVVVRDSKLGVDSPLLVYSPQRWAAFVELVASGVEDRHGDAFLIHDPRPGYDTRLIFTPGEWAAFADGCRNGEFAPAAV